MNILLTGSTGFIGSAIRRGLSGHPGVQLRTLVRRPRDPVIDIPGDLTDPDSLRGALGPADAVIHAASYVGGDEATCWAVNHAGTLALLAEAQTAGVRRFVYVSTAAVYGHDRHQGPAEGEIAVAPASAVSASRAAAEQAVLAAGGCVLRPHLVYGPGDRWVVPALTALLSELQAWVDGGHARLSLINVHDLARAVIALTIGSPFAAGRVLHANHPAPATLREIGQALHEVLGMPPPVRTISRSAASAAGVPDRHLSMIATDHWYESSEIWRLARCRPGRPFPEDFTEAGDWYPDLVRTINPASGRKPA